MPGILAVRLFCAIPVPGPVTRVLARDNDVIWSVLVTLLTGLTIAVQVWGLVALTLLAIERPRSALLLAEMDLSHGHGKH